MEFKFTDIFDIPALTRLCQHFTALTGKGTALTDLEGHIHISTGWQDICAKFHRVHPISAERCVESDMVLANNILAGKEYNIYQCKNGLVDVAVPVYVQDEHVANFFTGQFFLEPPDKNFFTEQAKQLCFPLQEYLASLDKVPVFSEQEIKLTMRFLVDLAQVIGEMGNNRCSQLVYEKLKNKELSSELKSKLKEIDDLHTRYESALSATLVGIWEWDIASNSVYWSRESSVLCGLPKGTIIKDLEQVLKVIHPDDIAMWQADVDACLTGVKDHNLEFRVIHPDSSIHWLHVKGSLVIDAEQKPIKMHGVVADVTDRKRIEHKLKKSEQSLKQAQKIAHIGSWELDIVKNKLHWSDEIFSIFEIEPQTFAETYEGFLSFVHPEDRDMVNQAYLSSVDEGEDYDIEHRLLLAGNKIKYVREIGTTLYNNNGEPVMTRGTVQDITDKKLLELQVEKIAYYDALTGLANRNLLNSKFQQAIALTKRSHNYGAVLFIDLDKFKHLNDLHGHDAGDALLVKAGERLVSEVRELDTVARIGGDEFLVLLTELSPDKAQALSYAQQVAEKLYHLLCQTYLIEVDDDEGLYKVEHICTASIGITLFDATSTQHNAIKKADKAMYKAKQSGGKHAYCQ